MSSKVARSSIRTNGGQTTVGSPICQNKSLMKSDPCHIILQSISNNPNVKSSHFFFNGISEKGFSDASACNCTKTQVDSPHKICFTGSTNQIQNVADVSQLSAANKRLNKEVESLQAQNKTLKEETVFLKRNLKNLKQQFNFVCSQQELTQNQITHLMAINSTLNQRLIFSDKKLDQYITAAFEQENQTQELTSQLASTTQKYQCQIAALQLKLKEASENAKILNNNCKNQKQVSQCPNVENQNDSDTFEIFKLRNKVETQSQLIAKLFASLKCLFKDRWSHCNWQKAKLLMEEHANSFVLARGTAM